MASVNEDILLVIKTQSFVFLSLNLLVSKDNSYVPVLSRVR